MEIRAPQTEAEWAEYFQLRYDILRKPWGEPDGTERDKFEDDAIHAAAYVNGKLVGVGRLHAFDLGVGQIRYMAVREDHAGRGVGREVLRFLEDQGSAAGIREIVLNARENAVGFYERVGYENIGEGPLLWGVIPHRRMRKLISKEASHA